MSKKRVVVTGMGLVSAFGSDVDVFHNKLVAGESGVKTISSFPVDDYPTKIAAPVQDFDTTGYIDPKQARRVDPCIAYIMVAGRKAAESAGLDSGVDSPNRCGAVIGSGMGGMSVFANGVETLLTKSYRRITPFFIPYTITNMGGALVAMDLGFRGPNYSMSTACATANYCIVAAANHIRKGDADVMLCGGGEASINPIGLTGFIACKALSQRNDNPENASRPWDKNRDGFVMGEGAGVLVLESLEHAQARGATILAEYIGGGMTCDAYHMTEPHPEGVGAINCMNMALEDGGISAEEVNYVNAHATSTLAGDVAEVKAIREVLGSNPDLKMNATKSMIGHGLGAAGGLEAIAVIKAIQTGVIHPTLNLEDPEAEISGLGVSTASQEHSINAAISNSFGFGGHNSSIILAPFRP
ncbi:MAG: beta-ketoacyl-ACP synthase II [Chlamydiota bacterium]